MKINPSVSAHQLQSLKLACLTLDISREKLDTIETFTDLYQLIEQRLPQNAPSLAYQMLYQVGVKRTALDDFKPFVVEQISLREYPLLDLILTLAFILEEINEKNYRQFREYSRQAFLDVYHPSRIKSRSHLLELLYDKNIIDLDYLVHFFAWLNAAACYFQAQYLREYCARQRIDEPDYTDMQIPDLGE